jgi:hypothetical protein
MRSGLAEEVPADDEALGVLVGGDGVGVGVVKGLGVGDGGVDCYVEGVVGRVSEGWDVDGVADVGVVEGRDVEVVEEHVGNSVDAEGEIDGITVLHGDVEVGEDVWPGCVADPSNVKLAVVDKRIRSETMRDGVKGDVSRDGCRKWDLVQRRRRHPFSFCANGGKQTKQKSKQHNQS